MDPSKLLGNRVFHEINFPMMRNEKTWEKFENSIFQRALKRHQKTKTRTSTYVVKLLGCSCLTSSNICDVSRVSACENPLRLFSFKSRYLGCRVSKKRKREERVTPPKKRSHIHFCNKKNTRLDARVATRKEDHGGQDEGLQAANYNEAYETF